MKIKQSLAILLCSVFAVTACSGPSKVELDKQSNILGRVTMATYNFENMSVKHRAYEMESLLCMPLDKVSKKQIAKQYLPRLMRILRIESDDLVKYYTILFIGNLGKDAKPAVPLLKQMAKSLPGSPAANKPYKMAIKIALTKIEGNKKSKPKKRR